MRRRSGRLGRFMILVSLLVLLGPAVANATPSDGQVRAQLAGLRLPFIENQGQSDARVAYYAPTFAGTLFVTRQGELVYSFPDGTPGSRDGKPTTLSPRSGWSLTETLLEGRARPTAQEPSPTGVSYFRGPDPTRWRSKVPSFGQVGLGEVWPGVAVSLLARGRSVEKVFTVSPGASVDDIRVRVGGAQGLTVDSSGALVATTGFGPITFTAPIAYQERDGVRRTIPAAYRLEGSDYRFTVGPYDPTRPLVIDPLVQSTYLGGDDVDRVWALGLAASGDVYAAGETRSADFPGTAGGLQPALAADADGFVALLNSALTSLIQVTYLGGTGFDAVFALAVSSTTGDVYVAGRTESSDFPGTPGGAQPIGGTSPDAFVARLSSTLTTLVQSTFLGGFGYDSATSLTLSSTGTVYVAGTTFSNNFPGTALGAQPAPGDGCGVLCNGDAFVALLNAALTALTQSTYLGGLNEETATALAIHPTTGDIYVTGETGSNDFPNTVGGAQPATAGAPPAPIGVAEAFVARLNSALTTLINATYLGGTNNEIATAIAIVPGVGVYVAGPTRSADFPNTAGSAQPALFSGFDAFVARFNEALSVLIRSTYLGGTGTDTAHALAISPTGDVYVAGRTDSANFPGTPGGAQPTIGGGADAFVARLSADLSTLLQSTYLGGTGPVDDANALIIDPVAGDVYVGGETHSIDFPGTAGGAQPATGGGNIDGFVSRLAFSLTVADSGRKVCCADFDGDGNDDILWRQNTGTVAEWLLNGIVIDGSGLVGTASNDWRIVGVGHFNGDTKADIVWRQLSTGLLAVWLLDGTNLIGTAVIGTLGPEWTVVGVADFNGDGSDDILWRDTAGALVVWLLNGTVIVTSAVVGSATVDWQVSGVGDFDGDGNADILWRNTITGAVAIWLLDGANLLAANVIQTVSTDWQIAGVGQFNGDAFADILWRNSTTGQVAVWLLSGFTIIGAGVVGAAGNDWRISGVGDFDASGTSDILWRRFPAGTVAIWFISGTTLSGSGIVGTVGFDWQIQ